MSILKPDKIVLVNSIPDWIPDNIASVARLANTFIFYYYDLAHAQWQRIDLSNKPKSLAFNITQTGTSSPTAEVVGLGVFSLSTVLCVRNDVGDYELTYSAFPIFDTNTALTHSLRFGTAAYFVNLEIVSPPNVLGVQLFDVAGAPVDLEGSMQVLINVYEL